MPLTALGLLVVAAAVHAGWNFLLKRAGETYIVTWWALIIGTLCFLPVVLATDALPPHIWPYVLGSVICQAAYFTVLASAYNSGDFSLVYPIARGAAPALLAVWAVLFLKEHPSIAGLLGLIVLLLGLTVIGSSAWRVQEHSSAGLRSLGLALSVALCISGYSAIDGAAVRLLNPATYLSLIYGPTALLITPVVYARYGWSAIRATWRQNWLSIALVGCLTPVSYMLVLAVYRVAPVSYAGAIREMSIVFAAVAGWRWLGEGFGALRLAGALLIFGGIVLIAVAG